MNRRGVTLLETLVALVILGLTVVGFLDVFGGSARLTEGSATWARGVRYAEEAMETVKLDPAHVADASQVLAGGFSRTVEVRSWSVDVARVTVVVALPGGGEFRLDRLVALR